VTRNPWNLQFSPGGSSGGSGASVAAGTSVIATASDIAGSTRIPASFCGLVGYKPPYGRVPGAAPSYLDTYRSDGPLTRTVADAALMYQVMAGQHPSDPVTLPDRPAVPSGRASFAGMQVAVARGLGDFVVEPAIAEAVIRTGEALADAGIEVTEIEIPWSVEETIDALFTHWGGIFAATPAAAIERAPDSVTAYARHMCERSQSTLQRETWMGGLTKEASMQARLADALRGFDALLLPTVGTFGFTAGDDYLDGASVNGTHLEHYLMAVLTAPFNICNRSPVLSVPIGVSDVGVPIGAQIVGKPYDEASVFQVAYALEHVQPWQQTAPMDKTFT
jgi:aspartyl-tRNA(Asn)/glutamyl-tRNA(Gln) amidotransferase subunit A